MEPPRPFIFGLLLFGIITFSHGDVSYPTSDQLQVAEWVSSSSNNEQILDGNAMRSIPSSDVGLVNPDGVYYSQVWPMGQLLTRMKREPKGRGGKGGGGKGGGGKGGKGGKGGDAVKKELIREAARRAKEEADRRREERKQKRQGGG